MPHISSSSNQQATILKDSIALLLDAEEAV
jgi:hypothetical protein